MRPDFPRIHRPPRPACRRVSLGLAFAFALLSGGCATQALKPGTGDVSFRLHWQGEADLDLHVVAPDGEHVGVVVPGYQPTPEEAAALLRRYRAEQSGERVPEGGVLDIDCNASPDRMCLRPIENAFWAPGTAPKGAYRFWALLFQRVEDGQAVDFVLEVRRGERIVETHRGRLANDRRESIQFEFSY